MKESKRGFKYGYKVVKFNGCGAYRSCVSPMRINYNYDYWTKQPKNCGPLAVFGTELQARRFIRDAGMLAYIFRCKYIPSKEHFFYWAIETSGEWWIKNTDIPSGTKFAKAVKLIRKVSDDIYLALAA